MFFIFYIIKRSATVWTSI